MNAPREPSAEMRVAAQELRQLYIALVGEHFTQQEALVIIGMFLANNNPQK